jgi:hypothetical protein
MGTISVVGGAGVEEGGGKTEGTMPGAMAICQPPRKRQPSTASTPELLLTNKFL